MNVSELQFSPFVNTYPSIRQAFSSIENWKKPEASRSCKRSCYVLLVEMGVSEPSLPLNGQFWRALMVDTSYMMFYYVKHLTKVPLPVVMKLLNGQKHVHKEAVSAQAYGQFFARGGGKLFAQKIVASCPNFYETVEKKRCNNVGRIGR